MLAAPIGPYEIDRRLALGGMAEVLVATRQGPHGFAKQVALKRILPRFAGDPEFVSMFIDEAKIAARLQHPNIVQVFDFGEHDGELFLAMEFVDGTNLNKLIRTAALQAEPIPLDLVLYVISQTASALAYAHELRGIDGERLGFVHRDVSPANILLTATGHVKLTDFGIATVTQRAPRTEDGHVRGKLGYMSPEQVLGRSVRPASDVFTLATVMAEFLLGKPLFGVGKELDILIRIRDVDLAELEKRDVPRDVRGILDACLAKDPAERPSAREVAEACDEVRRRRGMSHESERLTRLLQRLELIQGPATSEERPTDESPRVDTDMLSAEAARLVEGVGTTSPAIYFVETPQGERGPLSFPKLVELITGGTVNRETRIRKQGGEFGPAHALPELTRFVTSVALQWFEHETEGAERSGRLRPLELLGPVFEIMRDRRVGVLHLWDDAPPPGLGLEHGPRRKKIYFVDGRAEFVASTDRRELLGEHLVAHGTCMRMEVEMALALLPRYGGRLGDALVGLGVLRPVDLFRAIHDQVRERVLEAFRWTRGRWAFVPDVRSHEETFPIGGTGVTLLRDAVARCHPDALESMLSPHWEEALVTAVDPVVPAHAFDLPPAWREVLERARRGTTTGALLSGTASGEGDLETTLRAIVLGMRCGLLV